MSRRQLLAVTSAIGLAELGPRRGRSAAAAVRDIDVLFDTKSGSLVPASAINTLLARDVGSTFDRCVVAGEIHDHPLTHAAQFATINAARRLKDGRPLTVGFEMFYRQHTPILEKYVAGHISTARMLKDTKFASTWGYDPKLYLRIFQYCRLHQIPMVGLNVPGPLVSFVSHYGLSALNSELRAFLPEDVDTSNAEHFKHFKQLMDISGHSSDVSKDKEAESSLWKWYEAQCVWDEYMSSSVAMSLEARPESRMIALIGTGHVEGRTGIPDRIEKRSSERPFTIVPRAVTWNSNEGHSMPDIQQPETHTANVVWYLKRKIDLA